MPPPSQARISLAALNALSREKFIRALSGVIEHSPHFAVRVAEARPFASLDELHDAFVAEIERSPKNERLTVLRAHPDLADRMTKLTASSTHEQSSAGLDALAPEDIAEFQRLNTAYRERFGFPFIICARLNSKATILTAFRARLDNTREVEFNTALGEVARIARLRLDDLID